MYTTPHFLKNISFIAFNELNERKQKYSLFAYILIIFDILHFPYRYEFPSDKIFCKLEELYIVFFVERIY